MKLQCDILIIGAGIMGMTLAHELLARTSTLSLILIDKERDVALHGSHGQNFACNTKIRMRNSVLNHLRDHPRPYLA